MASARVRKASNSNSRGNTKDRARRRAWLLSPESGWGGNGKTVPCYMCGELLTDTTVTVDRIRMGMDGGTYKRDNIRPACGPDNYSTGAKAGNERRQQRLAMA